MAEGKEGWLKLTVAKEPNVFGYLHAVVVFFLIKREKKEPTKQTFSAKLQPVLCMVKEMEKPFSRKFSCHQ